MPIAVTAILEEIHGEKKVVLVVHRPGQDPKKDGVHLRPGETLDLPTEHQDLLAFARNDAEEEKDFQGLGPLPFAPESLRPAQTSWDPRDPYMPKKPDHPRIEPKAD